MSSGWRSARGQVRRSRASAGHRLLRRSRWVRSASTPLAHASSSRVRRISPTCPQLNGDRSISESPAEPRLEARRRFEIRVTYRLGRGDLRSLLVISPIDTCVIRGLLSATARTGAERRFPASLTTRQMCGLPRQAHIASGVSAPTRALERATGRRPPRRSGTVRRTHQAGRPVERRRRDLVRVRRTRSFW